MTKPKEALPRIEGMNALLGVFFRQSYGKEVIRHGMKPPWSLRDNPATLVVSVIGVLVVLFTLGWLTGRIGAHWAQTYLHRQTELSE